MSRAVIIITSSAEREKAIKWATSAPWGTRIEWKAPRRTLDQNARMYAMLRDISTQKEHAGRRYDVQTWKCIFLHALGRETRFVPALDGTAFIPIGQSSSDLSKAEMSDLIEMLFSWGSANGVVWSDPQAPKQGEVAA